MADPKDQLAGPPGILEGPWKDGDPVADWLVATSFDTNLAPATATLVLTGQTSTVVIGTVVQPAVATLVLTGQTSSAVVGTVLQPTRATMTLSGATSTVVIATILTPAVATLALSGATSNVAVGALLTPATATMTLSGATSIVVITAVTVVTSGGVAPRRRGYQVERGFGDVHVFPRPAYLRLRGMHAVVQISAHRALVPAPAVLRLTGRTATVTIVDPVELEEERLLLGIFDPLAD